MLNQLCERCERSAADAHLWCPDPACPAEQSLRLLRYGDSLGDLRIRRVLSAWGTAVLYEAERAGQRVWVKLAQPTVACAERLRREVGWLAELAHMHPRRSWAPWRPPQWLTLLPPYRGAAAHTLGEITLHGEPRAFCVLQPVPGQALRAVLLDHPVVWHEEAAWLTQALADTLRPMHAQGLVHLNLAPEVVWVERELDGHWRPALLDWGWLSPATDPAAAQVALAHTPPAYVRREAREGSAPLGEADVFALGRLFSEMLSGRPAASAQKPRRSWPDGEADARRSAMLRPELDQAGVGRLLARAAGADAAYPDAQALAEALRAIYGAPPPPPRRWPRRTAAMLLALALALVAGVVILWDYLRATSGG